MNKGRRTELEKLKFKKRLKNLGLWNNNPNGKFYCYKTTGVPCSCYMCSHDKYKRNEKHKRDPEDYV